MDNEIAAFSPSGWLEETQNKVKEESKPYPNLHNTLGFQATSANQSHDGYQKGSSNCNPILLVDSDAEDAASPEIVLMSGARGPGDSPQANLQLRSSNNSEQGIRYKPSDGNGMSLDASKFPNATTKILSRPELYNPSNIPLTQVRNARSVDSASQRELEQLPLFLSDSLTVSREQNEPQSAEMEISPTDLLHSSIIQSKPHLRPTSAEETQSHHPSTLSRSPQSSQQQRIGSPQRSCSKGSECRTTESNEPVASFPPAQDPFTSKLQQEMQLQEMQRLAEELTQNPTSLRTSRFTMPPKPLFLSPSQKDESYSCTSPTDRASITATTNSPFPRPGTPRPISPNPLRQSIERDFSTHRFVRDSTPAYLDRSYTPSPVSRTGDSDIPMSNAQTPTPNRHNDQASGELSDHSRHFYFSTQRSIPGHKVAITEQKTTSQQASRLHSSLPPTTHPFFQQYQSFHKADPNSILGVAGYDEQSHPARTRVVLPQPTYHRNEPSMKFSSAIAPTEDTLHRSNWDELERTLGEDWLVIGTVRHKKSLATLGSGAKVEKTRSLARAVSHGRPRKATTGKKQRAVSTMVPSTKMKTNVDAGPLPEQRRIDSSGVQAKLRDAEGEGKRRSARIKQRRSEGRDVIYTE